LIPCERATFSHFQGIQDFDDSMSMFRQVLLSHLDVHFGAVLLQTKIGVFLEPPRWDMALAYSAEQRQWRRMARRIT
jgi:hypothetical protein